jgi:hypothetical protein
MRSAKTCSTTAWSRWGWSAATVSAVDGSVPVGKSVKESVIPPHRKQFVLPGWGGVGLADAAHDESGGDLVSAGLEGGVADFGNFSVRDPVFELVVVDGAGITHRRPSVVVDGGDRGPQLRVGLQRDREVQIPSTPI